MTMTEEEKKQDKKIIVDQDWKEQAQKEKEILAAKEKAEKEQAEKEQEKPKRGPLPKGDFAALISMLVTQAFYALGLLDAQGQEGQKREPDLEIARYNIDMLDTIEEKTKGNLTDQEKQVLENTINEVRMAFVKVAG